MKKKMIAMVALLAIFSVVLAGCGKKAECFWCGEEKRCETETIFGEKVNICQDCLNDLKDIME